MSLDRYVHAVSPGKTDDTLAFVLHGTGGSETQLLALGREVLPEATLVSPCGDVSEEGAARFFRRLSEGRYDMADLERATAKMGNFVAAHVAARKPRRVVGIGYSNGANILASLIFNRRDLFDDAALLHPLIGWEPAAGALRTRVLVTAGERDPICAPALTRQLIAWFTAQGGLVEAHWHGGGHGIEGGEIAAAKAFFAQPALAKAGSPR